MNHITLKKVIVSALSLALIGFLSFDSFNAKETEAQIPAQCSEYTDKNQANLRGYILIENFSDNPSNPNATGNENRIYLNSEDDPWSEGPSYGASFVRDGGNEYFTGRGWNEIVGWVDFGYGSTDQAKVTEADASDLRWGGWNGVIENLNNIYYSTNNSRLVINNVDRNSDGSINYTTERTFANHPKDAQYTNGNQSNDDLVGLGYLYFDRVQLQDPQIPTECQEYVDLLLNGSARNVHNDFCGSNNTVEITWNSQNVSDCRPTSGAWNNIDQPRSSNNFEGERSDNITSSNSPSEFTLTCTGNLTGQPVSTTVTASCGVRPEDNPDDPNNPSTGGGGGSQGNINIQTEYIES